MSSLDDEINQLDADILDAEEHQVRWTRIVKELRVQRSKLVTRRYRIKSTTGERRSTDTLYIPVAFLMPHISQWIDIHNRQYRVGGIIALAELATISTKTIQQILNGHRTYVGYNTADRLLLAMGKAHLLDDAPITDRSDVLHRRPFSPYYED